MFLPIMGAFSAAVDFLTGNRVINAALVAWFIAQTAKIVIERIRYKRFDFRRIVGSGGMPSSHAACVCGAVASVGKLTGVHSVEFGIATIFAFIVIFDAVNVRRAAGEQAKILNYMIRNADKLTPELFGKELKELLGHTPIQVFVGILLGIIVGVLM